MSAPRPWPWSFFPLGVFRGVDDDCMCSFLSPNKILHLENLPFILQNYRWFGSLALKGRNIPRQLDFRWKFPSRSFLPSLGADNCSWCAAPESDSVETLCEPELLPLNNFFADLKSISPFLYFLYRCVDVPPRNTCLKRREFKMMVVSWWYLEKDDSIPIVWIH